MPVRTMVPGTCNICQETVPCNRIRRHLLRCVQARTGLKPSQDPLSKDRRRTALKTAYISVRSREQPHWLELGVRCDATLHELDRFLRCPLAGVLRPPQPLRETDEVTYSVMVPKPGDKWRFDPMDEREAAWRHMGKSVNAAIPVLTKFEHEFDYGSPTELELEHVAVCRRAGAGPRAYAAVARREGRHPGAEPLPAGLPALPTPRPMEVGTLITRRRTRNATVSTTRRCTRTKG